MPEFIAKEAARHSLPRAGRFDTRRRRRSAVNYVESIQHGRVCVNSGIIAYITYRLTLSLFLRMNQGFAKRGRRRVKVRPEGAGFIRGAQKVRLHGEDTLTERRSPDAGAPASHRPMGRYSIAGDRYDRPVYRYHFRAGFACIAISIR